MAYSEVSNSSKLKLIARLTYKIVRSLSVYGVSRTSKISIYTTVVMYWREYWALPKEIEMSHKLWERKVLKKIFSCLARLIYIYRKKVAEAGARTEDDEWAGNMMDKGQKEKNEGRWLDVAERPKADGNRGWRSKVEDTREW